MASKRPDFPAARARWKTEEGKRLRACEKGTASKAWKKWGPYLSERQWGTVREDYSADGSAWDYLSHDQARSRAYRWGEDGLLGISDDQQQLCFSIALWNGRDAILKERLFGLTNSEGNHGEDVKELYYYLDATPSHSYLKGLYKYPQQTYPYAELVHESRQRGAFDDEYELIDTGALADDRYFDVFIEYAQAKPGDIHILVTVHNRGPEAADLWLLPQLWFRNTWSWKEGAARPVIQRAESAVQADHPSLGLHRLFAENADTVLLTENETNVVRLYGSHERGPFKDAFHRYIVDGESDGVSQTDAGTKAAFVYERRIPAGGTEHFRLRLCPGSTNAPFRKFDEVLAERREDADEFYAALQRDLTDEDERLVQRQALAGMIWSKQFYHYDVYEWLAGDPLQPPPPPERRHGRNAAWDHLNNAEIISMPDKWEYPWYAAWDLAFHTLPLALVDTSFAKSQLDHLTREWYLHPNGQLPAYEWAFDDVNPPVHAWATHRVFQMDRAQRGDEGDLAFLERVFHKLLLNFTWWVNRKDADGNNLFQGGFLGLDNVGLFDRSAPLPDGTRLTQADGTSWMAMYSLNLMRIALELACHNPVYEDIATKFFEHFLHIADAMTNLGGEGLGLWDEDDRFYYDYLANDGGARVPLKVRSMVGLIPMFAVETLEPELLERLPGFSERLEWMLDNRPNLCRLVSRWQEPGVGERRLLSLLRGSRLKALLRRMLDETEFLSDYGIRGVSRHHLEHPVVCDLLGQQASVEYWPGESRSGLFGGNSNWRGPIWFPVNFLLVESLRRFHYYYGDDFKVECPTGSGNFMSLSEVADELARRLCKIFLRGPDGQRPVLKQHPKIASDPNFRDHVLFHEYFHGDSGRGVGASHQTGWTGLVAKLLQPPMS
jgi:hypothetical protein